MHTTNLRRVGGSVMLALPPAFLDQLRLEAGSTVGVTISEGQLVIHPPKKISYSLAQLLAESDYSEPLPDEEQAWVRGPAVGGELI